MCTGPTLWVGLYDAHKGPRHQLCLRKLASGSSTPLVRSYSRVDNHRAVIVYARAAYHPAYLKCCIPGMQHPHIRPLALPRYAGMQRYATGMQYAGMQRYAVCNSMHSPSGIYIYTAARNEKKDEPFQLALASNHSTYRVYFYPLLYLVIGCSGRDTKRRRR